MDDFDFIEDDDLDDLDDISFTDFDFLSDENYIDDSDDQCNEVLDNEFIDSHFNIVPSSVTENFPFVEDDVDAITDYQLFSKGFGYLDENKVNKDELSDVAYTGDYNDLSNKPDIPDVSEYVKKDTTDLENYPLTSSLSSVAFSGDYDDLSDKPTIPTKTSDITNDSGYITKDVSNLTYYTKTTDLPSIPTKTSDLTNDSGFITKSVNDLTNYTLTSNLSTVATSGNYNDLSNKPTIPTVPTNVSAFTNDAGYITKNVNDLTYYTKTADLPSVPTKTSDLTNDSGFITNSVNDLTNYPLTSSLSNVAFSGDYDDLSDKPTIPTVPTNVSAFTNDAGYITKNVNDLTYYTKTADLPSVPTKTSDLTNDSGFITNTVNDLTNYTLTSNLSTVATSGNYNDLSNKPTIPTVPTNVSAFTNDAGYITNSVSDLTNYTDTTTLTSLLANKENVIDVVTNTKGTCIKLDSGIAIQYGTYSYSSVSITNGYGSIYYALPTDHVEFPVSFINSNYSFNATEKTTRIGGVLLNTKDTSYVTLKVWQGINEGSASFDVNWIAIGLWK